MSSISGQIPAEAPERGSSDGFLRLVLKLDAILTGVNGLGYLALAPVLHSALGYDRSVQYPVGVFLLAYGVVVFVLSARPTVSRPAVAAIIALNAAWFVLSIVVAATDALSATVAGTAWLVLQGVVVGAFALLQAIGLRRS
ncbi:hypothetical protein GA0070216_13725 [Micromonospora matsumotoense]|uniref:SPW repeat-containing protein n=1 Tax=Micromonospora matsumotoense TaxID=121616 RepID=A0A1C5AWX7_9ACTN|nr:hypothetical protein [Micromonospora matsumotoense]SCF49729.1 hypothetical protein GA0070216_13725 [Micromonospora matsumotoense]